MTMQPTMFGAVHLPLGILPTILFLFFFAGMWCLVCFRISRLGWSEWAQIYRCNRKLQGKSYGGRSGRFSFQGSYHRILNMVLCNEGIGLSVMLPWRVGHPPLLLPWSKVVGVEERNFFSSVFFESRFQMLAKRSLSDYPSLPSPNSRPERLVLEGRFIAKLRLGFNGIELAFPAGDDHAGEAIAEDVDRGARHVHEGVHAEDQGCA